MSNSSSKPAVTVNGKTYHWPRKPVVVVCIDGGDPAYFEHGIEHGLALVGRQGQNLRDGRAEKHQTLDLAADDEKLPGVIPGHIIKGEAGQGGASRQHGIEDG